MGYGRKLSFASALEAVKSDKNAYFESSEAVMEAFNNETDNINLRLPKFFEDAILGDDVYNVNVEPMPSDRGGIAYYVPPTVDGNRTG